MVEKCKIRGVSFQNFRIRESKGLNSILQSISIPIHYPSIEVPVTSHCIHDQIERVNILKIMPNINKISFKFVYWKKWIDDGSHTERKGHFPLPSAALQVISCENPSHFSL